MSYSVDIRERVIIYVQGGGSQVEASRLFGVTRRTIYNWMQREDLSPRVHKTRCRKIDSAALSAHVRDFPDAYLRERAAYFGVATPSLWAALRRLKIVKKNDEIR
jgi:transposase